MRGMLHIIFLLSILILAASQASAQVDTTYFDATNSLIDTSNPVGTRWHQLYPNFCLAPYTITGWDDNGDGELSYCDVIAMENPDGTTECHHVLEVTITLELTRVEPPDTEPHYWDWNEDAGGDPLSDPVCTWWIEIHPEFGEEFHIVWWEDNGNGILDFCDFVGDESGAQYHVEGVHTDMVTEPADECATHMATWSRIKLLYR